MKKKLLATLLACAMLATLFASCSTGDTSSSASSDAASSESVSSEMEEESSEAASSEIGEESSETPAAPDSSAPSESQGASSNGSSASADVSLNTILDAVKNAYGESYLPSMDLTAEDLDARYGLKADDYDEALGQVAMISTQVDTFVAVKAKEGKADTVVSALNAYRDDLVNNSMQYPMNVPKVNASQVYQKGNYVFFIMLGDFAPEDMLAEDPETVTFYEEQNQIAVKAIDEALAG